MNTSYSGNTNDKPYYGQSTTIFGTTFRSKLEAEWAAFFTIVGIRWEYETHKAMTRHGGYIPDFYLPDLHGGMICEIKPKYREAENTNITEQKLEDACRFLGMNGTILRGHPYDFCVDDLNGEAWTFDGGSHAMRFAPEEKGGEVGWDAPYLFCVCPHCWKAGYEFDGRGERICRGGCGSVKVTDARHFDHLGHGDKGYSSKHPRIKLAAKTASQIVWQEKE